MRIVLLLIVTGLLSSAVASAQVLGDYKQFLLTQRDDAERLMQEREDQLRSLSPDQSSDLIVQDYLTLVAAVIQFDLQIFIEEQKQLPATVESFKASSAVAAWPSNPFNNFEPMDLVTYDQYSGFAAGTIVLQICPPSEYSGMPGMERPLSFAVSVTGPDEDFALLGNAKTVHSWDTLPVGAFVHCGTHFTSTARREEIRRQREATANGG